MMTMNRTLNLEQKRQLRNYFSDFVTERRFNLFNTVIASRTRYISVVLEDIYQSHNASAVMRSCDCFGVQDLHIIENENPYEVNPQIAMGSSQWLTLQHYNTSKDNTRDCINSLKKQGYRIVGTTPHPNSIPIQDFDISKGKFALMFGTELDGLTEQSIELSDELVRIPMVGFTESFNISVSAALCLYHFTSAIRASDVNWQLSEEEVLDVQLEWLRTSIKESERIEKVFLSKFIEEAI